MELAGYLDRRFHDDALIGELRARFQSAEPYSWLALDDFLDRDFVARLVAEFPQSGPDYDKYCIGEDGKVGPSYANSNPQDFPAAFRALDRLIAGAEFCRFMSGITGIPELEYDPDYFGGGIRESRAQAFLPPHIDFNYHPRNMSHRRLNLLIYLNEDWQPEWGGAIQVHRDPRIHKMDSLVATHPPVLNRCFIFETSECSWHGFNRLMPPLGRSRRAFTVYFYTQHRPGEEAIGFHNTEYVEPALPAHFKAGYVLSAEDEQLLAEAILRRDDRIVQLYRIRAEADGKFAHVWKEYEYYVNLSRSLREELDRLQATQPAAADE